MPGSVLNALLRLQRWPGMMVHTCNHGMCGGQRQKNQSNKSSTIQEEFVSETKQNTSFNSYRVEETDIIMIPFCEVKKSMSNRSVNQFKNTEMVAMIATSIHIYSSAILPLD